MQKFSEIKYVRPDFKKFKKEAAAMIKQFKAAKTYEEARAILLKLDKAEAELMDMGTVASIRNTINTNDTFYEEEMKYIHAESAKLMTLQKKITKAQISSPFRAQFDEEFGPYMNQDAEMQMKLMSFWNIPLQIKESNLSQEYSKAAAACKTTFRGEECNFYGLLKHMQSTDREERKEAFEAWAALYESISGTLDEQYTKLIAVRVKMAKRLGFKSYTDYAYINRQRYDYTQKDIEAFRENVVKYVVPACQKLYDEQAARLGVDKLHMYDEQLVYPEGNATPDGTKDQMVQWANEMYHELSPETGEFFEFMTKYELFDLETRPGKHMGGYCTEFPGMKAPFIFSNFNGTSADVDVLTHEAGHAFESYVASRIQPFGNMVFSTSEINEIHSMSMEQFTYPWMEKFFGENADKYRYAHLTEALKTIPYLVSVDEFQHRIYAKPDMSPMERRAVWHEIEKKYMPWRDYDGNKFLDEGGFWMQKQHIFLYPFYYVDYALAQTCAFTFFAMSLENREQAWKTYLELCKLGGSKGYFDTLASAGLPNPLKGDTVKNAVESVMKAAEEFRKKI